MSQSFGELRISNEAIDDAEELNRRLDEDGYLFIKRLFAPEALLQLRREMLTVMQAGGWLRADTDPVEGIACDDAKCTEGDRSYTDVYHELYKLRSFHAIAHCESVLSVLKRIRGEAMMPQPQKVARLWFPNYTEHTTPVHQDFVHFQGSFDNLTVWNPVGDCPQSLGGLAVLRGSHRSQDVLPHHFSLGAGSLVVHPQDHSELGDDWRTANYEIGDALIFPFLTIHRALPNVTTDRLRVSLDNRYQRIGSPIMEHMLLPHLNSMSPLSWDEVYADWSESDELKYYWRQHANPVLPRIMEYSDTAFNEAVALAEQGDGRAVHHLQRIADRDPNSDQGRRAAETLRAAGESNA